MKKILTLLLLAPVLAFAQSYPSPTYNVLTLQTPLSAIYGGTGLATIPVGDVLTGTGGTGTVNIVAPGPAGTVLTSAGTSSQPSFTVPPFAPSLATIAALNAATSTTLPQTQVIIAGFSSTGDGGGGIFNVGTTTTANGCTIFNDASGRSWYRQGNGAVTNVKWCGAKGDGSTNDTTAFVNAVAVAKSIYAPDGAYQILDNNVVLTSGQSLTGAGAATYAPGGFTGSGTIINCTNNTGHACIAVTANASWVTIANLTETRSVSPVGTAASGSNGIQFNGVSQFSNVHDVITYNNFIGVVLHDSETAYLTNVTSTNNGSHGVQLSNVSVGPLQWVMSNVLSQSNGGDGFLLNTTVQSGAGTMSVSNMDKIFTFGNTGVGFAVVGSSTQPVAGPRITNSFMGGDGTDEFLYNGFGGDVQITDSFFELTGTSATGPLGTTAASGLGSGIEIDNGSTTKLSGNIINGVSVYGINLAGGTTVTVTGNTITNSGQNTGTAGYGVFVASGVTADISGNTITNSNGNTTQKYAISNSGTITELSGNNLSGNITAAYLGTAPADSCNASGPCVLNQPNIFGVTNGGTAAAGTVGEYLTVTGSATSVSNGVTSSPTSLSLTAGEWDVQAVDIFTPAGGTVLVSAFAAVSTSATSLGAQGQYQQTIGSTTAGAGFTLASPVVRLNLSATTTVFAAVNAAFTGSTCTATGFLRARRVH